MVINLDEYEPGEPIVIIHDGIKKTFYEPKILVPFINPDSYTVNRMVESWEQHRFRFEIYGKDVELVENK